ncbi:MAG: hypothetical protein EOP04_16945, partial [Proteobacteria bacterium]
MSTLTKKIFILALLLASCDRDVRHTSALHQSSASIGADIQKLNSISTMSYREALADKSFDSNLDSVAAKMN